MELDSQEPEPSPAKPAESPKVEPAQVEIQREPAPENDQSDQLEVVSVQAEDEEEEEDDDDDDDHDSQPELDPLSEEKSSQQVQSGVLPPESHPPLQRQSGSSAIKESSEAGPSLVVEEPQAPAVSDDNKAEDADVPAPKSKRKSVFCSTCVKTTVMGSCGPKKIARLFGQ